MKFLFFVVQILIILSFQSCGEDYDLISFNDQAGFYLEVRSTNTQEQLFFGNNAIYDQSEFGFFIETNDSLVNYEWSTNDDENNFFINTNDFTPSISFDKLTDTFYTFKFQIQHWIP